MHSTSSQRADVKAGGWCKLLSARGDYYFYHEEKDIIQWDRPGELKSEEEIKSRSGEWFWVPSQKEGYIPARFVSKQSKSGTWTLEAENGTKINVSKKHQPLEKVFWSHLKRVVADLVMLDALNRPLICYNLKERYENNKIYTSIGTILISLNPYKWLPLYTPEVMEKYQKHRDSQPPHVFGIASDAFFNLWENSEGQSIVISGESGAGKTECTKQCLAYLAEVACSADSNIEQKILSANPILEAFGNAKTVRNNNSSRFGKYVEVFFDRYRKIRGARTTNYLLERSRVCFQATGERNFHVFFQLCFGSSAEEKKQFFLEDGNPDDFGYLRDGATRVDGIDDVREYKEMMQAFKNLNFRNNEISDVLKVTAGVLNLGNCEFKADSDDSNPCSIPNNSALSAAASLLGLTEKDLSKALLYRIFRSRGAEPVDIPLKPQGARAVRDALAKFIYGKLFDWLVDRINKQLDVVVTAESKGGQLAMSKEGQRLSIGILDIFGFEIFTQNSFEQLCINYANEKLQQLFNSWTFKKEQALYEEENIPHDDIKFIDNQGILDLIEKKNRGILSMVDEEIRMPKGSDETLMRKLMNKHSKSKQLKRVLKNPNNFILLHYAGAVEYSSIGFLEKSRDRLTDGLAELVAKTQMPLLNEMFILKESSASPRTPARSRGRSRGASLQVSAGLRPRNSSTSGGIRTIGGKFKRQLHDLMHTLNSTEPHYIRCIKPNSRKAALEYNGEMVLQQLQYSGVFEAVQIRKQGYPFRYKHMDFWRRYRCVFGLKYKWSKDVKKNVEVVLDKLKMKGQVQIGKSRVLYRAPQHRTMELRRNLYVDKAVRFLQRVYRGYRARKLKNDLLKVRPGLRKALKTRTLAAVDEALVICDTLEFPILEVSLLKDMKVLLEEEKRIRLELERLLKCDPEKVEVEVEYVLEDASKINYETKLTNTAKSFAQSGRARKTSRKSTKSALDLRKLQELKDAISVAQNLIKNPVFEGCLIFDGGNDLELAIELSERLSKELQVTKDLLACVAKPSLGPAPITPPPGAEHEGEKIWAEQYARVIDSGIFIEVKNVKNLLEKLQKSQPVTREGVFGVFVGSLCLSIRRSFANAKEKQAKDCNADSLWEKVSKEISSISEKRQKVNNSSESFSEPPAATSEWVSSENAAFSGLSVECDVAKMVYDYVQGVSKWKSTLRTAIEKRQRSILTQELLRADRFGLKSDSKGRGASNLRQIHGKLVKEAGELVERIDTVVQRLVQACATRDEKAISQRLEEIASLKLDEATCPELIEARELLEKLGICRKVLSKLSKNVYSDTGIEDIKAIIAEVKNLNFEPDPELKIAHEALSARMDHEMLCNAVDAAMAAGGLLTENGKESVDLKTLDKKILNLKNEPPKTTRANECVNAGSKLLVLRKCIFKAHGTKDKALWKTVDDALEALPPTISEYAEVLFAGTLLASQRSRDEVSKKLKQSIADRNQTMLRQFLKRGKELEMDTKHLHQHPEYTEATKLLAAIIKCLETLEKACEERNQKEMETQLMIASNEIRLEASHYPGIPKANTLLQKMIQVRNDLKKTTASAFEEEGLTPLKTAIDAAKNLRFENAPEFKNSCYICSRRQREDEIVVNLEGTCLTGGYVAPGADIIIENLQKATEDGAEHKMQTEKGKIALKLGGCLLNVRLQLVSALSTRDFSMWQSVANVVEAAEKQGWAKHMEVIYARNRVILHNNLEEAAQNAELAVEIRNLPKVSEWLNVFRSLGVGSNHLGIRHQLYTEMTDAMDMEDALENLASLLEDAEHKRTLELLETAIANGERLGFGEEGISMGTDLLTMFQRTKATRDTVGAIAVEAESCVKRLEENHMKEVLQRSREVKFVNENIKTIENLLESTPEQKLMQKQLRACKECKDFGRKVMIEIRLNNWYLKHHKAMFELTRAPMLKQRMGWAKQKLVCFNRQKLSETMFIWQNSSLHASLTNLPEKKDNSMAIRLFKNILGFMGDKALPAPIILAQDIVEKCIDNHPLIDEVYFQLIKQLTKNPSQASEDKGWSLMSVFLEFLKPEGIQKYLEAWLVSNAGARKAKLTNLLHQTLYSKETKVRATNVDAIKAVMDGKSSKDLAEMTKPIPFKRPVYQSRQWEEVLKNMKPYDQDRKGSLPVRPKMPITMPPSAMDKKRASFIPDLPPPADSDVESLTVSGQQAPQTLIEEIEETEISDEEPPPGIGIPDVPPPEEEADQEPQAEIIEAYQPEQPVEEEGEEANDAEGPIWEAVQHEGGVYYWNTVTNETTWDKPPDFDGIE